MKDLETLFKLGAILGSLALLASMFVNKVVNYTPLLPISFTVFSISLSGLILILGISIMIESGDEAKYVRENLFEGSDVEIELIDINRLKSTRTQDGSNEYNFLVKDENKSYDVYLSYIGLGEYSEKIIEVLD